MIVGRKLVSSPTARAFVLTRLLSLSRGALAPRTLCCWARGFRVRSAYGARLGVKLPPCRMAARPRQSPAALARGPFRCACAMLHSSSPSRTIAYQPHDNSQGWHHRIWLCCVELDQVACFGVRFLSRYACTAPVPPFFAYVLYTVTFKAPGRRRSGQDGEDLVEVGGHGDAAAGGADHGAGDTPLDQLRGARFGWRGKR